jgi:hypothetical protein
MGFLYSVVILSGSWTAYASRLARWQPDTDLGPHPFGAFNRKPASVANDNMPRNGKPKPRPAALS